VTTGPFPFTPDGVARLARRLEAVENALEALRPEVQDVPTGVVEIDQTLRWVRFEVPFSVALADIDGTETINLAVIPAGSVAQAVRWVLETPWAATGLTVATIDATTLGAGTGFVDSIATSKTIDLLAAPSPDNLLARLDIVAPADASMTLTATLTLTGAVGSALTDGLLVMYLLLSRPAMAS
jgi:hypothetical protein